MKIFLCDRNERFTGGAETYFNRYTKLLNRGHIKTDTFVFQKINNESFLDFINDIRVSNPDILHFNKFISFTRSQIRTLRNLNIPTVLTVHDLFRVPLPIHLKNRVKSMLKRYHWYFDHFVIPSQYYYQKLQRRGVKNIHFIPQFIDAKDWKQNTQKDRSKKLLFVGRLEKNKGIFFLLKVFQKLCANDPSYSLEYVGDGSERQRLKSQIEKLKLTEKVKIHGFQEKQSLMQFYHQSTLLVFPTISGELFGLVGLEAQVSKLPVLSSDLEPVKEWCKDGQSGLTFENGNELDLQNKIRDILSDDLKYQYLREQAFDFAVKNFSCRSALQKARSLYVEVLRSQHKVMI